MERPSILRAMAAGLLATVAMTLLAYLLPVLGLPSPDFLTLLGSFFATTASSQSAILVSGVLWHLNFGAVIFPHVYVLALYPILPGPTWLKGALFGTLLWVMAELIFKPMAGAGVLSRLTPNPAYNVLGTLFVHLLYGIVLGTVTGYARAESAVAEETTERHAA